MSNSADSQESKMIKGAIVVIPGNRMTGRVVSVQGDQVRVIFRGASCVSTVPVSTVEVQS